MYDIKHIIIYIGDFDYKIKRFIYVRMRNQSLSQSKQISFKINGFMKYKYSREISYYLAILKLKIYLDFSSQTLSNVLKITSEI